MEIFLIVITTIIGTVIGSFIGVRVSWFFIDRQDRKDRQRFAENLAPHMQSNTNFIAEMNSENNIQADMQSLNELTKS